MNPVALTVLAVVTVHGSLQPSVAQSAAVTQGRPAAVVDAERLMADVHALSSTKMQGRAPGTEGNRTAREYILRRFREIGVRPVGTSFEHQFSFTWQGATRTGTNLVGVIKGTAEPDRFTLIGAHYDHLGTVDGQVFHGADDNASGVAGLLAAASWFKSHQPARSLLFVAFDGEEIGLQGARRFVAKPPIPLKSIRLVINLDMISRGDTNTIYIAGTSHYPQLKEPWAYLVAGRPITVAFGHDRKVPGAPASDDWTGSSDHSPFHTGGIPFLYFGVEDHPDYHKPTDTADRIPVAFYVEAVKLVIDTIAAFSGAAPVGPAKTSMLLALPATTRLQLPPAWVSGLLPGTPACPPLHPRQSESRLRDRPDQPACPPPSYSRRWGRESLEMTVDVLLSLACCSSTLHGAEQRLVGSAPRVTRCARVFARVHSRPR